MRGELASTTLDVANEDIDRAQALLKTGELSETLDAVEDAIRALQKTRRMIAEGR